MKTQKSLLASILGLLMINLASAYTSYYSGGGFGSYWWYNLYPETLLQNTWVIFGGMFVLTFAIVYMALSKTFGRETEQSPRDMLWGMAHKAPNKGPVVAISLVVALFVAAAFSQRVFLYGYGGEALIDWILFIAFAAGCFFAINMALWSESPVMNTILSILAIIILLGYVNFIPLPISNFLEGILGFLFGTLGALFVNIVIPIVLFWLGWKILWFFIEGRTGKMRHRVKQKVAVGLGRARGFPITRVDR